MTAWGYVVTVIPHITTIKDEITCQQPPTLYIRDWSVSHAYSQRIQSYSKILQWVINFRSLSEYIVKAWSRYRLTHQHNRLLSLSRSLMCGVFKCVCINTKRHQQLTLMPPLKSRRNVTYQWWWPKCVKVWYSRYVWKAHCRQCTQITQSQYSFVTQFLPGLFGNPTGLSVHEPSVTMSSHTVSLLMKIRNEANLSF